MTTSTLTIDPREAAFGDYSPGRHAWELDVVEVLADPPAARGALGLWTWRDPRDGRVLRALSLTQPWASLIAVGAKRFETRSWSTSWRGLVAIHAAKGFPRPCRELVNSSPFAEALDPLDLGVGAIDPWVLPRGAVLCIARLVDVHPTDELEVTPCG